MGGQAVHHDDVGLGLSDQGGVDLIRNEILQASLGSLLLPHAHPDVGVDHVGPAHGSGGIAPQLDFASALGRKSLAQIHHVVTKLVPLWRGQGHIHAHLGRGEQQRGGHVVAVAHVGQLHILQLPPFLPDGEEVRQSLARVVVIGQAVDDRHPRISGQFLDVAVGEHPRHDAVHVAGQHPGHVWHALPRSQLDLGWREVEGLASQVDHPHFKRHPCPQAGFLEDHTQRLALQNGLIAAFLPLLFELPGQVQDLPDLFC